MFVTWLYQGNSKTITFLPLASLSRTVERSLLVDRHVFKPECISQSVGELLTCKTFYRGHLWPVGYISFRFLGAAGYTLETVGLVLSDTRCFSFRSFYVGIYPWPYGRHFAHEETILGRPTATVLTAVRSRLESGLALVLFCSVLSCTIAEF